MTQRFENPLVKFTTDTLQSLPGATLTFALSGSSTAKAVYADKSKTTSLGSIVTADSAGIFVPIWLDGTYRATLRSKSSVPNANPADGVIQTGWPIDNIGDNVNFTAFSAWDPAFNYSITTNTFVTASNGFYYQAIILPSFNKNPISEPSYWQQVYFLPNWNATVSYLANILVIYQGLLYRSTATLPNLNRTPPNLTYWENVSFNASITGPFTATGAITGGSFVTAGGITCATLAASGAITALTVTASGALTGNTVVSATTVTGLTLVGTSGATFGNTGVASAITLDWYEEGTFTPVVNGSATPGAGTYSEQTGKYTRVGNRVDVSLNASWTAHTGTGNIGSISGLPFVSSGLSVLASAQADLNMGAGRVIFVSTNTGAATLNVLSMTDNASNAAIAMDVSATIRASGTYFV